MHASCIDRLGVTMGIWICGLSSADIADIGRSEIDTSNHAQCTDLLMAPTHRPTLPSLETTNTLTEVPICPPSCQPTLLL